MKKIDKYLHAIKVERNILQDKKYDHQTLTNPVYSSRKITEKVQKEVTDQKKKILVTHTTNLELASRICKELNKQKITQFFSRLSKDTET